MTTATTFYSETLEGKTTYHIKLADIDNRGNIVIVSISKKDFESLIKAYNAFKLHPEYRGKSTINIYV